MKKFITLMTGVACLFFFSVGSLNAQWATNVNDIYNTNTGNVGIGTNTPSVLLDVSKNATGPTIRIHNAGGIGGAQFQMSDNASSSDWKFKATNAGGFKIRDHATGLDVFFIEKNALANALYIKQGGNVGLGLTNPLEKLEVNGAIRLGGTATNNIGTIRWNGVNFEGYDGVFWKTLDGDWGIQPNVPFGNLEYHPVPWYSPMSLNMGLPGFANPNAIVYIPDMAFPAGAFPHQLALETMFGPGTNVSQLYRLNSGPVPFDYTVGIAGVDASYKVCLGALLTPTAQSDNTTMIRANNLGIIDHPNQSRVRAYQLPNDLQMNWQLVFPLVWTPVNFDADAPLNKGWDEHSEFTTAPLNLPAPPPNAFFTATNEGYYQVNARTRFNVDYWEDPAGGGGGVGVNPNSYVVIAIWVDDLSGNGFQLHALGNQLQIAEWMGMDILGKLLENSAPNVADVVYLGVGHMVAIYVWHNAASPMNLVPGNAETYVSIHKDS